MLQELQRQQFEQLFLLRILCFLHNHKFLSELDSASISKSLVNDFENRKITKRVVSITKDETENKGINKSDVEDLEISISSKLGIDSSRFSWICRL